MTGIVAGFVLGLAGSGHCAVMCGPLTLALHRAAGSHAAWRFALHQAGRLTVYALAGAAAGGFGYALGLAGLGRALALATGAWLVARAVRPSPDGNGAAGAAIGRRLARLTATATRAFATRPHLLAFALGGVNGLLPCGMVYAALAASAALGGAGQAAAFMTAFGLGAVPALAALRAAAPWGSRLAAWRNGLATRLALVVLGASLLARGLGVGVPTQGGAPADAALRHHHAGR